jgi:hypothetical protein
LPVFGINTGKLLTILLATGVIVAASVAVPTVVAPLVFPSPTPTPTATLTPTPTGTPTPLANQPPIIDHTELREDRSPEKLVIFTDIYFKDADGDANFVDYELIRSSVERDFDIRDGHFRPSSNQKEGTFITGTWTCGRRINYEVTLAATIYDQAGHKSNVVEYTIKCDYVASP